MFKCELYFYLCLALVFANILPWMKEWISSLLFHTVIYKSFVCLFEKIYCDNPGPIIGFPFIEYLHIYLFWVKEGFHLFKKGEGDGLIIYSSFYPVRLFFLFNLVNQNINIFYDHIGESEIRERKKSFLIIFLQIRRRLVTPFKFAYQKKIMTHTHRVQRQIPFGPCDEIIFLNQLYH